MISKICQQMNVSEQEFIGVMFKFALIVILFILGCLLSAMESLGY